MAEDKKDKQNIMAGIEVNLSPEYEGDIKAKITSSAKVKFEATITAAEIAKPLKVGPTHYKSSLHQEHQLFGDIQHKAEQLYLFLQESPEIAQQKAFEVTGFDWTLTEQVAYHGLSILLSRSGYKGHLSQTRDTIFGEQRVIGIVTTWPEIFEACGLERNKAGKYAGRYVDDLKKAVLEGLPKPKTIFVKQPYRKGKETRYNAIQGDIKPIDVIKGYQGLREEEASQVEQGKSIPHKVNRLLILFHPLALREIESFYSLIPVSLYQDIKRVLPGYKGRIVPLFLRWLLSTDLEEIKIKGERLARILRIDYLLNPKSKTSSSGPQKKRLKEALTKCFEVAKALGFLLDFEELEGGVFYFLKPNPENLPRLEKKLERKLRLIEGNHEKDSR
jgi:hypothetical protein